MSVHHHPFFMLLPCSLAAACVMPALAFPLLCCDCCRCSLYLSLDATAAVAAAVDMQVHAGCLQSRKLCCEKFFIVHRDAAALLLLKGKGRE